MPTRAQPDRYLVMKEGAIIAQGDPRALRRTLRIENLALDTILRAALPERAAGGVNA